MKSVIIFPEKLRNKDLVDVLSIHVYICGLSPDLWSGKVWLRTTNWLCKCVMNDDWRDDKWCILLLLAVYFLPSWYIWLFFPEGLFVWVFHSVRTDCRHFIRLFDIVCWCIISTSKFISAFLMWKLLMIWLTFTSDDWDRQITRRHVGALVVYLKDFF